MRSRVATILKSKAGVSLMFVLAVMLLLMAIGVSALVAAGANAGFMQTQKKHSAVKILDDSVHRSIMYSLQRDPEEKSFLAWQLAMAIYKANDDYYTGDGYEPSGNGLTDFILEIDGVDLDGATVEIEIRILNQRVQYITHAIPAIPEIPSIDVFDEDDVYLYTDPGSPFVPRVPKTTILDTAIEVIVKIDANDILTTSRSLYEYTGGRLSDDPTGTQYSTVESYETFDMVFLSDGYGKWSLIKHEYIDSAA